MSPAHLITGIDTEVLMLGKLYRKKVPLNSRISSRIEDVVCDLVATSLCDYHLSGIDVNGDNNRFCQVPVCHKFEPNTSSTVVTPALWVHLSEQRDEHLPGSLNER